MAPSCAANAPSTEAKALETSGGAFRTEQRASAAPTSGNVPGSLISATMTPHLTTTGDTLDMACVSEP